MGKLEKIVVLSVLFLISVIIVLSLSTGSIEDEAPTAGRLEAPAESAYGDRDSRVAQLPVDRSPETSTPLERPSSVTPASPVSDGLVVEVPGRSARGAGRDEREAAAGGDGLGLLSSAVAPVEAAAPREIPEERRPPSLRLEADWDLKTVAGLERTPNPSFLVHRCARGETFEGLALELYGDAAKAGLLQRNNEGIHQLQEGQEILVPVRDDRGPDAGEYVVQEGESLWVIAKRFYGQGSRWGEIFEANRDVLTTPEAVRQGMTLVIP